MSGKAGEGGRAGSGREKWLREFLFQTFKLSFDTMESFRGERQVARCGRRPALSPPAKTRKRQTSTVRFIFVSCLFARFATQFRGATLGNRMEKVSSASPLQINKPAVIWRGGFKMPPRRVPATSQQQLQQYQHQQQHHQQQHQRADTTGTLGGDGRRGAPHSAGSGGGRGVGSSPFQPLLVPASSPVRVGAGLDAFRDSRLPGIPNILDSAGEGERGISGTGVMGSGGRGGRVSVGSLTHSADAPHRARYVRQR